MIWQNLLKQDAFHEFQNGSDREHNCKGYTYRGQHVWASNHSTTIFRSYTLYQEETNPSEKMRRMH